MRSTVHVGHGFRIPGFESEGLVKRGTALDVARDHAAEGQLVVVEVRVERASEALREGNGSELRVANRRIRARACVT